MFASLIVLTTIPNAEAQESKSDKEGFVSLFDGKTLDGWSGNMKHFRVEDGAIVAGTMFGTRLISPIFTLRSATMSTSEISAKAIAVPRIIA